MSTQIIDLPAGNRLYVSSTQGGGDHVWQYPSGTKTAIRASGPFSIGPFNTDRKIAIASAFSAPTFSIAEVDDERPLPFFATSIAANRLETIPADTQCVLFGTLTVAGTLVVQGSLRVAALPALT